VPDAPSPSNASAERVLGEQLALARAMLDVLDCEHRALLDGDTESLNRTGADKARLVEDLEALEAARRDFSGGVAGDGDAWREILVVLEQCRLNNQRNGALANARRDQIALALEILRNDEQRGLYDQSGTVDRGVAARCFGEA
jgi:flagellar biosynthesis/type III secretory pathway chaperone